MDEIMIRKRISSLEIIQREQLQNIDILNPCWYATCVLKNGLGSVFSGSPGAICLKRIAYQNQRSNVQVWHRENSWNWCVKEHILCLPIIKYSLAKVKIWNEEGASLLHSIWMIWLPSYTFKPGRELWELCVKDQRTDVGISSYRTVCCLCASAFRQKC